MDIEDKIRFIQSVFGSTSCTSKNIDVWCPMCAPTDKNKRKLSIRLSDDANHCWTCDWRARSLVSLIKRFSTHEKLIEYRDKFFKNDKLKIDITQETKPVTLPKDFKLLAISSNSNPDVKAAKRYLFSRGLTENDLWFFKIGLSNENEFYRKIIIPSFDQHGILNYYVARTIDRKKKFRYSNPQVEKLSIIFNEINVDWSKELILCEGVFDMFKCPINTVPLLGSTLSENSLLFNMIIVNNTKIILALDSDMTNTKVPQIAKKLLQYDVDVKIVDITPHSDPGSMTKKQFNEKLLTAKNFSWFNTINSKLLHLENHFFRLNI